MVTLMIFFALAISPESNSCPVGYVNRWMDSGNWQLVKNADGVQTYVRWTTNIEGKAIRERKGEMTVNCSSQEAVRLLTDAGSTGRWMSGVSENYYIAKINPASWYTYTLFSIPWPFNKRDLVSLFTLDTDPLHETVNILIVSRDNYIPLKPGINRLVNYRATWVIKRIGENQTKISFNATSSAPPVFPRPIQDPVIERIFHNNLVRLKEILST
jgi:hypothetical protein